MEENNRYLDEKINELQREADEYKRKYIKTFCVQNLRLFKGIINFTMPFVLSAAITTGTVALFGGGLPFVRDDIEKYKRTEFSCEESTDFNIESFYERRLWYSNSLPNSTIIIQTPWKYENGLYTRDIITYDTTSIYDTKIIEAIVTGDIDYILEKYNSDYKIETETSTLEQSLQEGYIIDADIHMVDKKPSLAYPESTTTNNAITSLDAIVALAIGAFIAYKRDFSILSTINDVKFQIHEAKKPYLIKKETIKKLALKKEAKK